MYVYNYQPSARRFRINFVSHRKYNNGDGGVAGKQKKISVFMALPLPSHFPDFLRLAKRGKEKLLLFPLTPQWSKKKAKRPNQTSDCKMMHDSFKCVSRYFGFLSVQIMQDNGWGRLEARYDFCFSFLFYVLASVAPLGHKIEGGSRGHPMKHAAAKDGCLFSSQRTCISRTAFENSNYKKNEYSGMF